MISKKVAAITGGSRGIGFGIARRMAKEGCALAIMSRSPEEKIQDNLSELQLIGSPVVYYSGNLNNANSRETFCKMILKNFGRIDFLVNNAGVAPKERKDILEMSESSYDFVMDINLKGTFFLTQLVANIMIKKLKEGLKNHPKIINISSNSAYTASVNRGEYCISKAGISMITSLFAIRLAEWGINVYEIRPGIIQTDMTAVVREKYEKMIKEGLTPIKRWGYPEDVAKAVRAVCSGDFDFSTGEIINIDGGFHLRAL
ncbi:MAG: 3-ketoacyl-ACP reductase [Bacteroidales bacterium]|nr:3-ketoacyl-ACP reductase [Bacteroidales bacterium]